MDVINMAAAFAAVRRQALDEAARVALAEVVVGNNLLDREQGASAAAERIAARLHELSDSADVGQDPGTEVYVVCLKNREGKARGAEKVLDGAFFMTKEDASKALGQLDSPSFAVFPATITISEQPVSAEVPQAATAG